MHRRPGLTAKDRAPLPPEKLAAMPVVFDPDTARLITNWATHNEISEAQELQLGAALDQIADFGDALRVPVWIFPDGRAPVPIAAPDLRRWLVQYEIGRAVYIARRAARHAGSGLVSARACG
jgi:hypothetical protein